MNTQKKRERQEMNTQKKRDDNGREEIPRTMLSTIYDVSLMAQHGIELGETLHFSDGLCLFWLVVWFHFFLLTIS